MKTLGIVAVLVCAFTPTGWIRAAPSPGPVRITISVSPGLSVPAGTTVMISARTSRPVSNIWIFDGRRLDIDNVLYVASCDSPPHGGFRRCAGRARYTNGVIILPGPPYRMSKKSGSRQRFFACWNGVARNECTGSLVVHWSA
jgi:hypothetical protein